MRQAKALFSGTLALALAALGAAGERARGDEVVLKDGARLQGEVLEEQNDSLVVKLRFGTTKVARDKVQAIVKKATLDQEIAAVRSAAGDAPARVALARRCLGEDRKDLAAALAVEALAIDARVAGARDLLQKLEWKLADGRWRSPADWHAARGDVRRNKRWMTREESDWIDAREAVEKQREKIRRLEAWAQFMDRAVTAATLAEGQALANVERAKGKVCEANAEVDAKKDVVDAKATDLSVRATKTIEARWTITWILAHEPPRDPLGRKDYEGRVVVADGATRWAARKEDEARAARDDAIDELGQARRERGTAERKVHDAQGDVEVVRSQIRAAQLEGPRLRGLAEEARKELPPLEKHEGEARRRHEERRARDVERDARS